MRCVLPGVMVNLNQNLIVNEKPVPTALRVRIERLHDMDTHCPATHKPHSCSN